MGKAASFALSPTDLHAMQSMKSQTESRRQAARSQDSSPLAQSDDEQQNESADVQSTADALEAELLLSPPKGNLDRMRVLRSRLKRLSSSLPESSIAGPSSSRQSPTGEPEDSSQPKV